MVRHLFLVQAFVGSNPTTPAKIQMTESVYFSLNDCSLKFGKKKIFENVSISLHKKDKVALVGKNGVGKTTLLKTISGKILFDTGDFWFNSKIKIGSLNQTLLPLSKSNSFEYLYDFLDSEKEEYFIHQVCEELKIDKNKNIKNLSGGEHRKLNLASLLIKRPDLILLDEPTNHLDIESINWLEDFLIHTFDGSFIITSHNRGFLKNVTNKVFWLDRHKIKVSPNGFKGFEDWKSSLIAHEIRELDNKKKFLIEETEWMAKGVTARRKRNMRRKDNFFALKEEYEKQKSEFLKSISRARINVSDVSEHGTNILINFHKVSKKFITNEKSKIILNDFSFKLLRGDKVGIIGKNGSGKTTFLKIIGDSNLIDQGTIKIRKNIKFNYFDQSGSQFDNNKSIKENLIPSGGDYIEVAEKKIHICGYLKNFLFDPKNIDQKVGVLSGGERNRLLLAKILSNPKEILLLDEPTNDLDMETIDILIDFLNNYKGGVFIVSHDQDFLEKTANKFLFFDGNGNTKVSVDFDNFLIPEKREAKIENNLLSPHSINTNKKSESTLKKINKILKKIEYKESYILKISKELEKINQEKNFDYSKSEKILLELKNAQNDLSALEKEWYLLEEKSLEEMANNEN